MGELVVGDVVFDETGQPTMVLAAHDVQEGLPCYQMIFSDGARITCDSEHLWYTETKLDRTARHRTVPLRQQHGIAGIHRPKSGTIKTTQEIYETLRYQGESNHVVPCAAPLQYAKTSLPLPAYILGTWLGDGTSNSAQITTQEVEIADRWQGYALTEGLHFAAIATQSAGQATTYSLTGREGWFQRQLRALGVFGPGNKHIPWSYLYSGLEDRLALLRGLMDTDGSANSGKSTCEWSQKSPVMVQGFLTLLSTFGIKHSVYLKQINGQYYHRVSFSSMFCPFHVPRKASVFRPGQSFPRRRYIIDMIPVPSRPVRCIEVDSPSHLFLCGKEMIPTHNTVLALYQLIADAYANTRPRPRYGYLAPLYRQGKVIAWDMLKHLTRQLPGTKINEAELRVDLTGDRRIQIFGADNPDALRGLYLDGAVFDEYGQMRPRVWSEVVRPALADREGWATFIGTPMGKNHFYDLYQAAEHDPTWHRALYTVADTGVLPEDELASARNTMAPEQYAQEFECSFESALIGSYYGSYLDTARTEDRITRVPWEPSVPVHVALDIGVGDSTAIWFFQAVGKMIHVIDYLEASDHGIDWYAKVIKEKQYVYGRFYWPHDAEARDFSSDGRTRLAIAESLGLRPSVVVPRGDIGDGIAAVRNMFPRFVFDADKCHEGLESLKSYRRDWNESTKTWSDRPRHDWASHGSDALRCFAVGYHEDTPAIQVPSSFYHPGRGLWGRR